MIPERRLGSIGSSLGGHDGSTQPHLVPTKSATIEVMVPLPPPSEHSCEDPHRAVVAGAKQAILDGDRSGALALLRVLLNNGPEFAATLTPVLAEALIATARDELDAEDQRAREAFDEARAARAEICRLLRTSPLDTEDLSTIRMVLDSRELQLQDEERQRMAEQRAGGSPETLRLGLGWLERYWVDRRWGPYLRARWRQEGRKRMKYIGKIAE